MGETDVDEPAGVSAGLRSLPSSLGWRKARAPRGSGDRSQAHVNLPGYCTGSDGVQEGS